MTLQTVILKRPHTHAGIDHAAGDSIQVHSTDMAWLKSAGVIDAKPAEQVATNTDISSKPARVSARRTKE